MPVSPGFKSFVLEQLEQAAREIRHRAMFGGVGIYAGEVFFALLAGDVLYFKVDDETRPKFVRRKMRPFQPYGPAGETMGYYELPIAVLEDTDELRLWVKDALAVAQRAQSTGSTRRSSRRRDRQ